MTTITHLNCGTLSVPGFPTVVCHCLACLDAEAVVLIDSGIGLQDVRDPSGRLGGELVAQAGFRFNEHDTALRRLGTLGIEPGRVTDIVLTHADPDHTGGLADFPGARVHLSDRELEAVTAGRERYTPSHFAHAPRWVPCGSATEQADDWYGFAAWPLRLPIDARVLMVDLPGHTVGHRGVAIERPGGWLLHAGDAYYLRGELDDPGHPAGRLAQMAADDDERRLATLQGLRGLVREHGDRVEVCCYHDLDELPDGYPVP